MGFGIACLAVAGSAAPAGGKKDDQGEKKAEDPLVVVEAGGKEVKVISWHLDAGTRRLPGLDGTEPKPPPWRGGPTYLEFREEHSTTYEAGILTLVPVRSLRKLDYDYDKKVVVAVVATADGKDVTLTGSTKYKGINRVGIMGDADLPGFGWAEVKFQGGNPQGGITGVRFPAPQPVAEVKGDPAVVVAADKEKTRHPVADLTALYLAGGHYYPRPQLMFKKTVKVELSKLASLRRVEPEDKKQASSDFEVALRDGEKHTLTLLTKVELDGGKAATFVGLIGRVPVGYKLFPPHTVAELQMGEEKK
jgi:hypothetical protein